MSTSTPSDSIIDIPNHAYAIIGVYDFNLANGTSVKLVKIYNPWRKDKYLNNHWADESLIWTDEIKEKVSLISENDGAYFVDYKDYFEVYDFTY